MKLCFVIVSNDDSSKLVKALIKERFFATKLSTTGGLLMTGNTTLLIGVEDEKVDSLIEVIGAQCKSRTKLVPNSMISDFGMFSTIPVEVKVGGATLFVIDIERFVKI